MEVFISWSGERSNKIAVELETWLRFISDSIKPFVSSQDISAGKLWRQDVAKHLQNSDLGIICVTKENFEKPWLLFEAGALSKEMDASSVVPLFLGIEPSDLSGNPLADYQGTRHSEDSIRKLVFDINDKLDNKIESAVLEKRFNLSYTELKEKIDHILALSFDTTSDGIVEEYPTVVMEELLIISRNIQNMLNKLVAFQEFNPLDKSPNQTERISEVVQSLLSWGTEISKVVRTNQTYDFVMQDSKFLKDGNPAIKITGTHIYTVFNKSQSDLLEVPINMKDELGIQSADEGWGFESVFYTIESEGRTEYPLELADSGDRAKKNITFLIRVPPNKSVKFEFTSAGLFLPSDRYIWYSQDFCKGCLISVTNETTTSKIYRYQINHRDEDRIKAQIHHKDNQSIININSHIFPHEGFSMYWRQEEN